MNKLAVRLLISFLLLYIVYMHVKIYRLFHHPFLMSLLPQLPLYILSQRSLMKIYVETYETLSHHRQKFRTRDTTRDYAQQLED